MKELSVNHLLGIKELSHSDIKLIFEIATKFKEVINRPIKKVPTLRDITVANLFFENSTRTKLSFELAEKRLSAEVLNFSSSNSSLSKGESLIDTVNNILAMKVDLVVIRHPDAGAASFLSKHINASVINAGDGYHEHPSQGLLDIFTMQEKLGDLNGKHVVVIGRSNIVGRPISILSSLKELGNATVTLCHSGTKDLKYFSTQADILVAALGSPEFVDSSYIKEGACLVDVGINRIEVEGKSKIVGDVNQESVTGIASSLTPVPKGVGPMTIAMLVENTVLSAELLLN